MFTGIIEEIGEVVRVVREGANLHLFVKCTFTKELKAELLFYRNLIKVYDQKVTKKALDKAEEIVRDVDPEDVFFIALHLHTGHKIWSGDEKLKKGLTAKGYGHFFTSTEELKKHLYKKRP